MIQTATHCYKITSLILLPNKCYQYVCLRQKKSKNTVKSIDKAIMKPNNDEFEATNSDRRGILIRSISNKNPQSKDNEGSFINPFRISI